MTAGPLRNRVCSELDPLVLSDLSNKMLQTHRCEAGLPSAQERLLRWIDSDSPPNIVLSLLGLARHHTRQFEAVRRILEYFRRRL